RRHPLPAHPAHPGGAGERVPRAARAGRAGGGRAAMSAAPAAARRRVRVRVEGTVQGVGFRPYVYRLARELALAGFVLNDERGVLVEIEGEPGAVASFVERLPAEAPPLARVDQLLAEEVEPTGSSAFAIAPSPTGRSPDAPVAADSATCDDCLAELFDPADRRH